MIKIRRRHDCQVWEWKRNEIKNNGGEEATQIEARLREHEVVLSAVSWGQKEERTWWEVEHRPVSKNVADW
jgi:hypothetical protein